jgi:hypothetical protein
MRIEIFRQRQSLKSKKLKSYILDNFATVSEYGRQKQALLQSSRISIFGSEKKARIGETD